MWKVPRYYKTLDAGLAVQKGNKGCLLIYGFTISAMGVQNLKYELMWQTVVALGSYQNWAKLVCG